MLLPSSQQSHTISTILFIFRNDFSFQCLMNHYLSSFVRLLLLLFLSFTHLLARVLIHCGRFVIHFIVNWAKVFFSLSLLLLSSRMLSLRFAFLNAFDLLLCRKCLDEIPWIIKHSNRCKN